MNFLKNNRTPIIAAVVGILAIGAYYFVWGGSSSSDTLLSSAPASSQGQQLLATLGDLNAVTLDPAIFKNATFVSLADFGTVIPAQAAGRHNPFAPTGAAAPPPTSGITVPKTAAPAASPKTPAPAKASGSTASTTPGH